MADIVESTPAELNVEGDVVKEKTTCDETSTEPTEKGDCGKTDSPCKEKIVVDTTDEAHMTGTKRKSDDAENEDEEEAKKVRTTEEEVDGGVENGSEKTAEAEETPEKKGEEEVVKKVVEEEETPTAEEVASS